MNLRSGGSKCGFESRTEIFMDEIWKDIPGWVGRYQVSDQGRVRCLVAYGKPLAEPRIRRLTPDSSDYLQVGLSVKHATCRTYLVHHLVLLAFVGPKPEEGLEGRHLDGDHRNNRLDNLMWGTRAENYDDRRKHGTDNSGERAGAAKLTWEDVEWIRAWRVSKLPMEALARAFGVACSRISDIATGKSWRLNV